MHLLWDRLEMHTRGLFPGSKVAGVWS